MLELFHGEGVVLGDEGHVVGEVGGIGPLRLHVSLECVLLSLAFKGEW